MNRFLAKRVGGCAVLLAGAALLLDSMRVQIPVGLLLGGFVALYKTRLFGIFLGVAVQAKGHAGMRSALFYLLAQLAVLLLLTVAVLVDLRFFIGVGAGLLLLPAVICINGLTEKAGITHNRWGACG